MLSYTLLRFIVRIVRYALLAGILITQPFPAAGQQETLRIRQLPTDIDWINTSVNDILQDHRGFLWLGTWSGLARYDGYKMEMFHQSLKDSTGLKSNKITCLFEDRKNRLWIGTNYSGFYRFDRLQNQFIQYSRHADDMNSLSNDNVWAITEDSFGYLWIGTENGLNRFDPENGTFIHYMRSEQDERTLSHNFVYALAQLPNGDLWVGTETGLNRLVRDQDGNPQHFVRYMLAPEGVADDEFLDHNFVKTLEPSVADNTLWAGTSIGLKRISYDSDNFDQLDVNTYLHDNKDQVGLSHSFVSGIYEESSGRYVWIATYDGLNRLDIQSGHFEYYRASSSSNSLNDNIVKTLFCDRSGVLWIGTEKGLNHLNLDGKPFKQKQFPEGNNIISSIVHARSREGLWVGTSGGGIVFLPIKEDQIQVENARFYSLESSVEDDLADFIVDLILDKSGTLWITTKGAGVFHISEADIPTESARLADAQQLTKENVLQDDYVMVLHEDANGGIWMGYWDDGLTHYDPVKQDFKHFSRTSDYAFNLQSFPIVQLTDQIGDNGEGILWIGMRGGGVAKLQYDGDGQQLYFKKHYQHANGETGSLTSNAVNCFLHEGPTKLWIGTENGLNLLDLSNDSVEYFLTRDEYKKSTIQSIISDDKGQLWVTTHRGITRLSLVGEGYDSKHFDEFDGLDNDFFYDASCQLKDGQIVFGGVNGMNIFDPSTIQPNRTPPQVTITDLKIFNKSVAIGPLEDGRIILQNHISETDEVVLGYKDNVISIEFVGLQCEEPRRIQYAYKLDGFDTDWVFTDYKHRIAHYTNLPHDTYQFKVKVANGDGYWSEPVGFDLIVEPPFWLTRWAMLVYMLAFAGLLYGVRQITSIRVRYEHSLELERLEREKLEEVNQLKLQFFTNISHELRTPLTLILSPLEQFIREQKVDRKYHQGFLRMHHNANRLMTMINQLLDIRKSESGLMELKVVQSDIVKFCKEILLSFQTVADQSDVELTFSCEADRYLLWFDRQQMEKVFYNLLSNAMKFTPKGGRIEMQITQPDDDNLQIQVQDSGAGISPEDLPHIFDRFYQAKDQDRSGLEKTGTGIGLSLAKSIVDQHGGTISVESTPGKGTSFMVMLRTTAHHFGAEQKISNYVGSEDALHYQNSIEPQQKRPLIQIQGNPEILIVEDNADIRAYLREHFEAECTIREASNGEDGLASARENPPDLIIADISMPKMDGIRMCAAIKSSLVTSHIPIILLTARTSLVYQLNGLETGADDYITKPFDLQLLKARAKNLIESRLKLRERFTEGFDFSPEELVISSLDEELLKTIKEVVEKHIDDSDFSVEQLATAVHMSRMQLYRKLKALTGKSPNQILRSVRMQRAAQLLANKQFNIADVTYMVGYNDLKSFRDQFRKEFGMSPSQYRSIEE